LNGGIRAIRPIISVDELKPDRTFDQANTQGETIMSLGTILIVILIIFLLGGFSGRFGGYGYGFGHRGVGIPGVILIVVIVLALLGRI
jgi:ABC-type tungstate transport system substrate-binding protein